MLSRLSAAILSLLVVWSEPALFARQWALGVPKGATVVVKAPAKFWKSEASSFSTGTPIFTVDANAVLARQDWQTTGLPYFGEFVVTKVFEFKPFYKLKYTDVELRNSNAWVKLRFQPGSDINGGVQSLTLTGTWKEFEASDCFKNVVFGTVASTIFTGANSDSLQVYAPLTAIKLFSSADITSQQFVDQCVVILNSNRIQVLLSNAS
jgi:hypothetical protein